MSKKFARRRQLKNIVIDRGALARLSVPFVAMIALSTGIVFAVRRIVMDGITGLVLVGPENVPVLNALFEMQNSITMIATWGSALLGLVCFFSWVVFSHRIFGPTIALRRHIKKLKNGDYSSRAHLRAGDELHDLADELNELAETLEEQKVKRPRSA
jgi:HAMP domain-containing protein